MEDEDIFDQVEEEVAVDVSLDTYSDLDEDEINMIFTRPFMINPTLWQDIEKINAELDIDSIKEVKYVRDDLTKYDEELNTLPSDKGGIYFFFIKQPILHGTISYLVYVGRARKGNTQNLKKRCREYFYDYNNVNKDDNRTRKVRRMIKRWGKYLYLQYIELDNNDLIDSMESLLINNIRPPFNSQIPSKIFYTPTPTPAFE